MRLLRARNVFAIFICCLLFGSTGVSAQLSGDGLDVRLFRNSVDSKGYFAVNGTDVLGHNDFSFGLIMDAAIGVLPFYGFEEDEGTRAEDANRTRRIIDQFYTGAFHFNYGLFDRLVMGVQFPIHIAIGQDVRVPGYFNNGATSEKYEYQNIGDLSAHLKFSVFSAPRNEWGLAVISHFQFPTGYSHRFGGEPNVAIWPIVAVEWQPLTILRTALNLGYRVNTSQGSRFPVGGRSRPAFLVEGMQDAPNAALDPVITSPGLVLEYQDLFTYGISVGYKAFSSVEFVGEFNGTAALRYASDGAAWSLEGMLGARVFVQKNSYLLIAAGAGLPTGGFQAADFRGILGFVFEPSIDDVDGDGLGDGADQCPDQKEDVDLFEDEDGCPDEDNDQDGILDALDACPLLAEDFDGNMDEDGCPEEETLDADGDGLLDEMDQCPNEPEDKDGFEDEDGCIDPDNDKDGVLDRQDICPDEPEDLEGFEDEDGCPDFDNDQDRIPDEEDECPDEPETYNGTEDEDGCPDQGSIVLEGDEIVILDKIYFETDSTVIQERSFKVLDAVAAVLNASPQILLVEIQGHADERGNDDYNLKLTQGRTEAVKEALSQRNVQPERLRSVGYGELCPLDKRHNRDAWDKNRRVEFKIVETDRGPVEKAIICPAGQYLTPE